MTPKAGTPEEIARSLAIAVTAGGIDVFDDAHARSLTADMVLRYGELKRTMPFLESAIQACADVISASFRQYGDQVRLATLEEAAQQSEAWGKGKELHACSACHLDEDDQRAINAMDHARREIASAIRALSEVK